MRRLRDQSARVCGFLPLAPGALTTRVGRSRWRVLGVLFSVYPEWASRRDVGRVRGRLLASEQLQQSPLRVGMAHLLALLRKNRMVTLWAAIIVSMTTRRVCMAWPLGVSLSVAVSCVRPHRRLAVAPLPLLVVFWYSRTVSLDCSLRSDLRCSGTMRLRH